MKFSQSFQAQSTPQWASYNVDYVELKKLIKLHTNKSSCQGIVIPGQADASLEQLEKIFQKELTHQYDRIDLFVKSKVDEIDRRLHTLHGKIFKLISRIAARTTQDLPITLNQRDKIVRYTTQIQRCIEDTKYLKKFVAAQRVAFHKILRKYKKCTGSIVVADIFHNEIFNHPKSFIRRDFNTLLTELSSLDKNLRVAVPEIDQIISQDAANWNSLSQPQTNPPQPPSSITPSSRQQDQPEILPQYAYWNEYDHGSDAENEPYIVYIDPESDSFPGAKTLANVFSKAKKPIVRVKEWLVPVPVTGEQKPLLGYGKTLSSEQSSVTCNEVDQVYISSTETTNGYSTFHTTILNIGAENSTADQTFLLQAFLGCYAASITLLLIAWLLSASGKKKLRIEVDAGIAVGVISSLLFATIGFFLMYFRCQGLSWMQRCYACATYVLTCTLNGMLLLQREIQ